MGKYNFQEDLMNSQLSVAKVVRFLFSIGATDINYCDDNRFDLRFTLDGTVYTLEVKEDLLWEETGKVALEYHSRGKDSGVRTSKADIWCYVIGEDLYFSPLSRVKQAVEDNIYFRRIGGDNNTSLLILMTLHEFKQVFHRNYLGI
jgi:hypothetical protein